jgi:hypothetical protein
MKFGSPTHNLQSVCALLAGAEGGASRIHACHTALGRFPLISDFEPEPGLNGAADAGSKPARALHEVSSKRRQLNALFRFAILSGSIRAVQLQIERGVDLESRDENGMTPLMLGASRGRGDVCQLFLAAGADSSAQNNDGNTACDIAARAGFPTIAVLLAPAVASHSHRLDAAVENQIIGLNASAVSITTGNEDLSTYDWEPDEIPGVPPVDDQLLGRVSDIQTRISTHEGDIADLADDLADSVDDHLTLQDLVCLAATEMGIIVDEGYYALALNTDFEDVPEPVIEAVDFIEDLLIGWSRRARTAATDGGLR